VTKTNPLYTVEETFSGKNISSAASVYQFTAAADEKVQHIVKLTNAAGNGDYIVYLTRQWEGAGDVSVALGKATFAAGSGETVIEFTTMQMQVKKDDVIEIMIEGQAGDTSVDGKIRIIADNPSVLEQADILSDSTPFDGADIDAKISDVILKNMTTAASSQTDGTNLLLTNKVTFSVILEDITIPSNWEQIRLTVKKLKKDEDDKSILQLLVTNGGHADDGIQYVNRAEATEDEQGYGYLTPDEGNEELGIDIEDDLTFSPASIDSFGFDVKIKDDASDSFKPAKSAVFTIQLTETLTV